MCDPCLSTSPLFERTFGGLFRFQVLAPTHGVNFVKLVPPITVSLTHGLGLEEMMLCGTGVLSTGELRPISDCLLMTLPSHCPKPVSLSPGRVPKHTDLVAQCCLPLDSIPGSR